MAKKQEKAPSAADAPAESKSRPVAPPAKAVSKPEAGKPDGEKKSPPTETKEKSAVHADPLAEQAKKSFSSWVTKVDDLKGKSLDDIYALYQVVLDEERKKAPGKPDVEHHKRALRFFKLKFKQKSVGAGRVKVSGIFYAFRGAIDQVAKRRADILKEAALNPKKSAKDGTIMTEIKTVDGVKKQKILLDEEGKYIPRDNKQFYDNFKDKEGKPVRNPRFGKPLPANQWSTTYFGLFSIDDDEPQLAFFQMRGTDGLPSNCPVPMNTPCSFYAYSVSEDKATKLKVISGFKTKFTIEPDLNVPTLWQAFENGIFTAQKKSLADLNDWCAANAKNFNAFFVCDVNVLSKMEEKNSNGTFMITMDDDSLGFADDTKEGEKMYASLTGFVPGMFEPLYKTFAELSRIAIIAAARRDFKKDENGKVVTNTKGEKLLDDPVVSVWGFDVDPEFIEKPREIDDATEGDMEKAGGKSEHQDIDDEVEEGSLKSSKAEKAVEADDDDDEDDDETVEKPKEDTSDDEDEEPEKEGDAKPAKKKEESEPDDDDIDAILDEEVDEASK